MNLENLTLAGKIISSSYAEQAADAKKGFENKIKQLLEQVCLFDFHYVILYIYFHFKDTLKSL